MKRGFGQASQCQSCRSRTISILIKCFTETLFETFAEIKQGIRIKRYKKY